MDKVQEYLKAPFSVRNRVSKPAVVTGIIIDSCNPSLLKPVVLNRNIT